MNILLALVGLVCIFWIGMKLRDNMKAKKNANSKVINLAERRKAKAAKEAENMKKIKNFLK